jgi:hypothetical protein
VYRGVRKSRFDCILQQWNFSTFFTPPLKQFPYFVVQKKMGIYGLCPREEHECRVQSWVTAAYQLGWAIHPRVRTSIWRRWYSQIMNGAHKYSGHVQSAGISCFHHTSRACSRAFSTLIHRPAGIYVDYIYTEDHVEEEYEYKYIAIGAEEQEEDAAAMKRRVPSTSTSPSSADMKFERFFFILIYIC